MGKCIACYSCSFTPAPARVMKSFSPQYAAIRIKTREVCRANLRPISAGPARSSLRGSLPYEALVPRVGGGVKLISDKCTGCEKLHPGLPGRIYHYEPGSGKIVMCIHCGICSKVLPSRCSTAGRKWTTPAGPGQLRTVIGARGVKPLLPELPSESLPLSPISSVIKASAGKN